MNLSRSEPLLGKEGLEKLKNSSVCIVGCGGVGSFAVEGICRAGVGNITVCDGDTVSETNVNRQLIADSVTLGRNKAELERERILRINPGCGVRAITDFLTSGNVGEILAGADFIIDACDDVGAKLEICRFAAENGIRMISCMGTGNRLSSRGFEISDISRTETCPLARSMRKKLRELGIPHVPVLFSREVPLTNSVPPSSVSFVPPVAGMMLAEYAVKTILDII